MTRYALKLPKLPLISLSRPVVLSDKVVREVAFIMWSSLILMGGNHFFTPLLGGAKHFFASFRGGAKHFFALVKGRLLANLAI